MSRPFDDTDRLAINTLRCLAIDMIESARSGHPGLPLGAAPMAYVLFQRHLNFDPADPDWPDRDRFVLSAGHGSALLYALLHLYGYDLGLEDLRRFRQWGSRTPGHPEYGLTPGVEATTGPLGQGTGNSVGMAVAERLLARRFGSDVVDHRTFALVSDGDLMEGISYEAASLAGRWRLGRLTWLYDANGVSLDAPTDATFTEDVRRRFEALGWHVAEVADGDEDLEAIDGALLEAREETERPSLVIVRTTIGYASPLAGTPKVHGAPLGEEGARKTKERLGWTFDEPFAVPDAARDRAAQAARRGRERHEAWRSRLEAKSARDPDFSAAWEKALAGVVSEEAFAALPRDYRSGDAVATRSAAGRALNAVAAAAPLVVGGDADLSSSTKTRLEGEGDFGGEPEGRNLRFGVREHAMGAIANGMAYHGGVRPFTATFLVFSDYMRPPIRLAALAGLPVVFVFTHDSIAVGEDGPTHQPVEHLPALRAVPNLHVVRPADAWEANEAWRYALERRDGPTALVLTRQAVPVLDRAALASADGLHRGGYALAGESDADVVLLASGSEVPLALEVRDELLHRGASARVVSVPCVERFLERPPDERARLLGGAKTLRVVIEAAVPMGWERVAGGEALVFGVERFGASAPGGEVLRRFGFQATSLAERILERLRAGGSGA